ncbi:hypothetical protein Tco_0430052, partial [Tanacetum coccineum]
HAVATASVQNDNGRCSRSGSLMFNAFFFEISIECLVQELCASVSMDSNYLSLKIALNHREKVFENFWCFILGVTPPDGAWTEHVSGGVT